MQSFLTEHWELVIVAFNLAVGAAVFFAVIAVRLQFRHIKDHQAIQDRALRDLESRVGTLDKDSVRTGQGLENLSKTLEHYFEELKEELLLTRTDMKSNLRAYTDHDEKAHREILERLGEKLGFKKA